MLTLTVRLLYNEIFHQFFSVPFYSFTLAVERSLQNITIPREISLMDDRHLHMCLTMCYYVYQTLVLSSYEIYHFLYSSNLSTNASQILVALPMLK